MEKNVVKINENTIRKIVAEALKFQRVTDPNNPKGNVGPKDENLNFFVTIGEGPNRRIVGDKGFKTREAAERKAEALRSQGKSNVRIISKKSANENTVKVSENTLKQIVAESVKKVLKEGQMGFSRDADSYGEELRSRELNGMKPQRDELREHSRKILMGIYDDLHTWETYAMDNSNGIDKQAAYDAYTAAMEAIETLGKAFYGDEFWGN